MTEPTRPPALGPPPPANTGNGHGTAAVSTSGMRAALAAVILVLSATLILVIGVAVAIGSVGVDLGTVASIVWHHLLGGPPAGSKVNDQIVWNLRMPRVLLAAIIGGGLAVVGATLQATVRNPLADPYVLGVSAGAGFTAALTITLGSAALAGLSTSAAAFCGALVATGAVLGLGRKAGRFSPGRLVLGGITLSYLFTGATSFVIFQARDPEAAESVLFWLLGSVAQATWSNLAIPAAAVAVVGGFLITRGRALNALAVGEEAALSLGIAVHRERTLLLLCASLLTGVLVAAAGGIGFVGLIIPHLVRLVIGPDHRRLLPIAMLVGAIYLVAVDLLCRVAVSPEELPVGIVTSLLGAPLFLWLLRRSESAR